MSFRNLPIARKNQLEKIAKLYPVGRNGHPIPRSLFVYGHSSTGKTTVLDYYCDGPWKQTYRMAKIDCLECFTPRLMFESILDQWGIREGKGDIRLKCDNFASFLSFLKLEGARSDKGKEGFILILDRCESMRDNMPNILASFLRLSETLMYDSHIGPAPMNISVILVSSIVWERFRSPLAVSEPILLHFPDYMKEDMFEILEAKHQPQNPKLFQTFLSLLYSIFHGSCKDLSEYMYLTNLLYPIYIRPISLGQCSEGDTGKLFRHIEGYFKDCLSKLYLRELSASDWKDRISPSNNLLPEHRLNPKNGLNSASLPSSTSLSLDSYKFELPIISKFLMLAAYLASYNPVKSDLKLFGSASGNKGKTKKINRKPQQKPEKEGSKVKTSHLAGPKPFALERMLAIFYNLLTDPVPPTVDINLQISTLISRRLLLRSSPMDKLDGIKLKCNVSLDFIVKLGKSVNIDINKYLFDFI